MSDEEIRKEFDEMKKMLRLLLNQKTTGLRVNEGVSTPSDLSQNEEVMKVLIKAKEKYFRQ